MIPATTERVPRHTAEEINEKIRCETETHVRRLATLGDTAIRQRLSELDREWDIERALEANAATVTLIGVILGVAKSRKWFALPGIVGGFLLQHAVQGWCPPVPVMRRLGFRTAAEINRERCALKALRGDFDSLPATGDKKQRASQALSAVDR
jgi:hypothetical protein